MQKAALDRLCGNIVKARAGAALFTDNGLRQWYGPCQRCHKPHWLSWCHVVTRAKWVTRWDLDNSFAWCAGCHRHLDQHWEEKSAWVLGALGPERYEALMLRARGARYVPDFGAMRAYLVSEQRRLGISTSAGGKNDE